MSITAAADLRGDRPSTEAAERGPLRATRASGVRSLGAYEGSGFREDHYLVKRADGQVVHLSRLLYLVLHELDGGRDTSTVAARVSAQLDRQLTAEGATYLLERKLIPAGLATVAGGAHDAGTIARGGTGRGTGTELDGASPPVRSGSRSGPAPAPAPGSSTRPPSPPAPGSSTRADSSQIPASSSRRPASSTRPPQVAKAAPRANPLLALRLHRTLLPASVTRRVAQALLVLFEPLVIGLVLLGLVAVDVALLAGGAGASSMTTVLREPTQLLVVVALLLSGTLFHEFGHATACRYGGGIPGVIGVGVYVIFPAFYTNVTDAYRLGRRARLRTDLGGVYFNAIAALVLGGAYLATGFAPLLVAAFLMHLEALQQFLPLVRMDGYFILADVVGVPDLFGRIRPVLASLLPWRGTSPRVRELRPAARVVITAWVLVVVPVLGAALAFLVVQTPTWVATTVQSLTQQWAAATVGVAEGSWAVVALAACSMALLAIPMAGLALFFVQLSVRLGRLVGAAAAAARSRLARGGAEPSSAGASSGGAT